MYIFALSFALSSTLVTKLFFIPIDVQPPLTLQHFRLEASSEDELWEKILGIDWSKVAAE